MSQLKRYGAPPKDKSRDNQPSEKRVYRILGKDEVARGYQPRPWDGLDCTGTGLRVLGPPLFRMTHLTHLYLSGNALEFVPPAIRRLPLLQTLDLSNNDIQVLPGEVGRLKQLRELLLYNNAIASLPFELGKAFRLAVLGLHGNPLAEPLLSYAKEGTGAVINYLLDSSPKRQWIRPENVDFQDLALSDESLTVFCYNILADRMATRALFGYCPTWALDWDYRRQHILKEILSHGADVVSLQEVETSEYTSYFQPQLHARGYGGYFRPKSRSRTMMSKDSKHVDGCAVFYQADKYRLVEGHVIEFERMSTKYAHGCADMLNRVMPKDNIAIACLLETIASGEQTMFVNCHLTWDPVFKDVKVIQTVMMMAEINRILQEMGKPDLPLVIAGDFNSLPDSGVYEFLSSGKITHSHPDFEGREYHKFFQAMSNTHKFRLKSAYSVEMPFTNFTYDFCGVIDYIWYSGGSLAATAVLGPVDEEYMSGFDGAPNAHFPSDHLSLKAEVTRLVMPAK